MDIDLPSYLDKIRNKFPLIENTINNTEIIVIDSDTKIDKITLDKIKRELPCYRNLNEEMLYGGYIAFCCEKEKGIIVLANNKLIENTFDENVCVIFHELLHIYKDHCSFMKIPSPYEKLNQYLPEKLYYQIAELVDNVSNDYIINKFLYRIMPDEIIGLHDKSITEFYGMKNNLKNNRMLGDFYIMLRLFCLIKSANCIIDDINIRNKNYRYLKLLKQNYFYKVINKRISCSTLSNKNILFTTISEIISDEWRFG